MAAPSPGHKYAASLLRDDALQDHPRVVLVPLDRTAAGRDLDARGRRGFPLDVDVDLEVVRPTLDLDFGAVRLVLALGHDDAEFGQDRLGPPGDVRDRAVDEPPDAARREVDPRRRASGAG